MRLSALLLIAATAAAAVAGPPAHGSAGPAARDVAWDLRLPPDPDPTDIAFVDGWIAKLPRLGNDSTEMGDCIATLLTEENWPKAYPRLCRALASPGFDDLYGASEIILELGRRNRSAEARRLFGFVMKASEHVTAPDDLNHLALICLSMKERKAVPRLIELLQSGSPDVRSAAAEALAATTGLPPAEAGNVERMQAWWGANWSRPQAQILAEQLRSPDSATALEAAAGLCELRDASIFPVLFKILRGPDPAAGRKAIAVIQRATGRDWSYDPAGKPEERAARVDLMEKWWKEERLRFTWPGLPRETPAAAAAASAPPDESVADVGMLGSGKAAEVQKAESRLRARAAKAVPALIAGLADQSLMVRRRSYDILRDAAHHDIPYDPRGDDAGRSAAVAAWQEWAVKQKLMGADGGAPDEEKAGEEKPGVETGKAKKGE